MTPLPERTPLVAMVTLLPASRLKVPHIIELANGPDEPPQPKMVDLPRRPGYVAHVQWPHDGPILLDPDPLYPDDPVDLRCGHCTATCGHCSGGCTATCQGATLHPPALLCAGTGCIASDPGVITRMAADDLAVLKNQLGIAMQQVDRREEALRAAAQGAALQPQTIAEVDALEKKLSEALDELRTRRAELQK